MNTETELVRLGKEASYHELMAVFLEDEQARDHHRMLAANYRQKQDYLLLDPYPHETVLLQPAWFDYFLVFALRAWKPLMIVLIFMAAIVILWKY